MHLYTLNNPPILHIDIVSRHDTCVIIWQEYSTEKINQMLFFLRPPDWGKTQENIHNNNTLFGENVFSIRNQWWFWCQFRKPVFVLKDIHWPCWHAVIAIHQETKILRINYVLLRGMMLKQRFGNGKMFFVLPLNVQRNI